MKTYRPAPRMKKELAKGCVLLRRQQVLQRLSVSNSTFRRMINDGDFPDGEELRPRIKVWPEPVVDAWIENRFS